MVAHGKPGLWLRLTTGRADIPPKAWRAARRMTAAVVTAGFPILFFLDEHVHWALSPVLPGLVLFVVLIVALPILATLAWSRLHRRREPDWRLLRARRADQWATAAAVVAFVWFFIWLALGA